MMGERYLSPICFSFELIKMTKSDFYQKVITGHLFIKRDEFHDLSSEKRKELLEEAAQEFKPTIDKNVLLEQDKNAFIKMGDFIKNFCSPEESYFFVKIVGRDAFMHRDSYILRNMHDSKNETSWSIIFAKIRALKYKESLGVKEKKRQEYERRSGKKATPKFSKAEKKALEKLRS